MKPPDRSIDNGGPSLEMLGTVGIAGVSYFFATILAMHFIQPDLRPIDHTISEYALGRWGWLMTLGWVVGGVAVLALALGLRRSLTPSTTVRVSIGLMVLSGLVGFIASGLFRTDVPDAEGITGYTGSGQLHDVAGLIGFLALLVGAFILATVFAQDPRWSPMAGPTRWFAWAMLGWLVVRVAVAVAQLVGSGGLVQRIVWPIMLGWLALVGWRMRRLGRTAVVK
jgi:hypothetical protein